MVFVDHVCSTNIESVSQFLDAINGIERGKDLSTWQILAKTEIDSWARLAISWRPDHWRAGEHFTGDFQEPARMPQKALVGPVYSRKLPYGVTKTNHERPRQIKLSAH
jgi:hypothetical protein